jgi:predicted RND superfamily exporter protein
LSADLLKSLKVLNNLSILSRQKEDLKKRLHIVSKQVIKEINSLKEKLPEVELPKEVKKEIKEKKEAKKDYTKRNLIDEELKQIQEKLDRLNSLVV